MISRRQTFRMPPLPSPARTIEQELISQVDSPSISLFRRTALLHGSSKQTD